MINRSLFLEKCQARHKKRIIVMLTPIVGTRMEDTTVPATLATTELELYVRTLMNAALFLYTTVMKRPRVKILRPISTVTVTQVLFL